MNKEIVKEQIVRSLEDILDQTNAIFDNEGKIPQIEIDIIMANVRKLYEQYINLNKFNIILSEQILSPTARAYAARRAHDRQLPKNEFKDPAKAAALKAITVIPEAKIESVTPVIQTEADKTRIEEEAKTPEIKRPLLRFETMSEPAIEPMEDAIEPLKVEIEPALEEIISFKIEEEPAIEKIDIPEITSPIVIEEQPITIIDENIEEIIHQIEENTAEIDAIINEIIEEPTIEEEPIVEKEVIIPVIEESIIIEPLEASIPEFVFPQEEIVIDEIKIVDEPESDSIIISEEIAEENKVESISEIPSLFPDFIAPKPEPVKRKKPKSPLDLFADNSSTLADKFKDEGSSLNDKLSEQKEDKSLASKLQNQQITDLKKGVGINEKFLFINELFDGNMAEYNQAIDHINANCTSIEEADAYIIFLKQNYNWDESRNSFIQFRNLLERRFPRQA